MDFADDIELPMNCRPPSTTIAPLRIHFAASLTPSLIVVVATAAAREIINFPAADAARPPPPPQTEFHSDYEVQ